MSFIIDLAILAIALTAVCHGISKGFVKSGMRLASVILAIVMVFSFTAPLSSWIEETFVKERVSNLTEDTLSSIVNAGSEHLEIDEVLNDRPEALSKFAERFKFNVSDIEEYYNDFLSNLTRSDALKALSEKIAAPTAASISTVCAAIVILIAVSINSLVLCIIGLCLTGMSYGSCPTITAAVTSSFFGMKNFSTNMALMTFTVMGGSLIATVSTKVLELTGGYAATFGMLLTLTFVALVLNIFIKRP